MDEPVKVVCFAVNALGNDSALLLEGGEGVFKAQREQLGFSFMHSDVVLLRHLFRPAARNRGGIGVNVCIFNVILSFVLQKSQNLSQDLS